MDLYHTTDTQGVSELNPSIEKMRQLLASLDAHDANDTDHPDVSLVHDPSGWSLCVYPSGVVTLENFDQADDLPHFMHGISRKQALELWIELSRGEIQQIHSHPWLKDQA